MTDPDQLETRALDDIGWLNVRVNDRTRQVVLRVDRVVAAVRELAAHARELDALVQDLYARSTEAIRRGEAFSARAEAAEADRDRLQEELGSEDDPDSWINLKRQRDRYRTALEQIERDKTHAIAIAQAALADTPDTRHEDAEAAAWAEMDEGPVAAPDTPPGGTT